MEDVITKGEGSETSHDDLCYEVLGSRHNRLTAEQDAYIVKLQGVGFAAESGGVVDAHPVLHKGFVAATIIWWMGIDRYLKEGAASAACGFESDSEYCTLRLAKIRL